jgi:hypothetical protein
MLFSTLACLFALSSSSPTLATPAADTASAGLNNDAYFKSSVFEKLAVPPIGWARDDNVRVDKELDMVKLRIHLIQQNMRDFHELAMSVCTLAPLILQSIFQVPRSK